MTYRSDIDGLRAFSVLSVIAFHLNGLIPGGYVGVDVFFVISGFLIGGIVFEEIYVGTFAFADFYRRRIRRIAPALLLTLLASYAASIVLTGPSETIALAKSSLAALFSVANIYFYATSGYFSARALDIPLLHLWSLGIEEQFYVIFPLIAVLLSKYFPRLLVPVLVILGLSSLLFSQIDLYSRPEASFYLLHDRAFELTIGVLLARLNFKPGHLAAQLSAVCGAVLLAGAIFLYNDKTRFPGVAALVPCLGAALIISSGQQGTTLRRIIGARPFVFIGKISYPLYLAHWPFIVFGKIAFPELSDLQFAIFVVAGSVFAATLAYYFIERPIRYGNFTLTKMASLSGGAALSMTCVIVAISTSGFIGRYDPISRDIANFKAPDLKDLFLEGTCFLDPEQSSASFMLQKCLADKQPEVLLWGDSHAAHHFNGLKFELEKAGYSLGMLTASACPPLIDYRVEGRPFCKEINDYVLSLINARKPAIVILAAFWKPYPVSQLGRTLDLLAQNHLRVVVLGNTPIFQESVPLYLARHLKDTSATDRIKLSDRSAAEVGLRQLLVEKTIPGVRYISLQDMACPGGHCLLTDKSGYPYYFDEGHMTKEGSRWIARQIISDILLSRPPA